MSKSLVSLVAVALFLLPASAFAQNMSPAQSSDEQANSEPQSEKKVIYEFPPDMISGTLIKPTEETITGKVPGKTSRLLNIRADFLPEMLASVEEI